MVFSIFLRRHRAARSLLTGLLLCIGAQSLAAQSQIFPPTTPRFAEVLRLAQESYPDSARKMIDKMIAAMSPNDPAYAEALYTAASINRPIEDTKLLFSRIALDYSSSAWADKALYRLALIDFGLNKMDASITSIKRIFSDYPKSPVIPSAALWGSKAAFGKNDMQLGCDWLRKGLALVGSDVELKNQLDYGKLRCSVGNGVEFAPPVSESLRLAPTKPPVTATDTSKPPVTSAPATKPPTTKPPATKPPAATEASGKWRIQVAAVSNTAAIQRAVTAIKKLGLTAYQVKTDGKLIKVQAGPFATKEAAAAQIPKVAKAVGGKPFAVKVP